jgi:hypothetical protein
MSGNYTIVNTLLLAGVAAGVALLVGHWQEDNRSRELDIKMVEIAIGILREENDEKGKLAAAKGWAVDVINQHSEVNISSAARAELIERPLTKYTISPINPPTTLYNEGDWGWLAVPDEKYRKWLRQQREEPKTPVINPEELPAQQKVATIIWYLTY